MQNKTIIFITKTSFFFGNSRKKRIAAKSNSSTDGELFTDKNTYVKFE